MVLGKGLSMDTDALKGKNVLVVVPSLSLVKQVINSWARETIAGGTSINWLAVCSDQDVSDVEEHSGSVSDLGIQVTTDISHVANFLATAKESELDHNDIPEWLSHLQAVAVRN